MPTATTDFGGKAEFRRSEGISLTGFWVRYNREPYEGLKQFGA